MRALVDVLGDYLVESEAYVLDPSLSKQKQKSRVAWGFDGPNSPPIFLMNAMLQIDPEIASIFETISKPGAKGPARDDAHGAYREDYARWRKVYDALKKRYPAPTGHDGQTGTADGDLKQELARFEGTWSVVKEQMRGKTLPVRETKYIFRENIVSLMVKESIVLAMAFKIDPSKAPKMIDLSIPTGKARGTRLGIYEFKDDTLTLSMRDIGEERAASFADTDKTLTIIFLKRDKDADPGAAVSPKQASKDEGPLFAGKPASYWLGQLNDTNPKFRGEAVEALGSIAKKNKDRRQTPVRRTSPCRGAARRTFEGGT
jgi:uncharacterized protein (TIGR03067 family)